MLWLKNKFSLSDRGTIELALAILANAFQDFALLLPTGLIYSFIMFITVLNIGGLNMADSRAVFYLGWAFICALLIFAASWFQYNMTFSASYKESSFRRLTLAETLRKIPLSFLERKNLTNLAASIMNDCAVFETSETHFIAPFGGAAIFILFMSFPMIYINWRMALAVLWVVPAAFIVVGFSRKIQKFFSRASSSAVDSRNSHLYTSIFVASSYLILRLGVVSAALMGTVLFSQNSLQFADFLLFIMIALRLYAPLEIALQNFAGIIHAGNNDTFNEIINQNIQTGAERLTNKNFDIEFQRVSFTDESGQEILHDISFTAHEKQITILRGSGNITAVKLMLRFYNVNQGAIRIGGENINQFDPEKLMSLFSVVSEDSKLINSPIIENIRLGRKNAGDKDVLKAAEIAKINISRLPDGYKLSRLESQKISIARAILKDAPIVLLDESVISPENKPAITSLINNKTVIIISHDMQNFTGADKEVNL